MTRDRSSPPPEELLPTLDLEAHLRDPAIKQRFVTVMFDVIADRYDRFTRLFSYGMDTGWKRQLMAQLSHDERPALVVDLASGTGDLALAAAERRPAARVLAFDVSRRMVQLAARRTAALNGRLTVGVGDMVHLPLPKASADVVTVGYGIRNAPTPGVALAEIARVLRPGGLLLVLDFYRPRRRLWRALYLWYLRAAGNLIGWLWHGAPVAYGYIGPSIAGYLSAEEFTSALEAHGFTVQRVRRKLFGGVALHSAVRH
jgi:demethylmenaquinone methyltransferase/2-methoxy-6-polyprenyl-1,4-benzoquinol methylase